MKPPVSVNPTARDADGKSIEDAVMEAILDDISRGVPPASSCRLHRVDYSVFGRAIRTPQWHQRFIDACDGASDSYSHAVLKMTASNPKGEFLELIERKGIAPRIAEMAVKFDLTQRALSMKALLDMRTAMNEQVGLFKEEARLNGMADGSPKRVSTVTVRFGLPPAQQKEEQDE